MYYAKNIGKSIGKKLATDAFKTTLKSAILKITKATGDLIGNKTADGIRKVSKNSQQNNSEIVENEHDK